MNDKVDRVIASAVKEINTAYNELFSELIQSPIGNKPTSEFIQLMRESIERSKTKAVNRVMVAARVD